MAGIKTDPSQTKTVVALIGVLVVIGGVTVVRINPGQQTASSVTTESAAAAPAPVKVTEDSEYVPVRNPFERPAALASGQSQTDNPLAQTAHRGVSTRQWHPGDQTRIPPMPIVPGLDVVSATKSVSDKSSLPSGSIEAKPKPVFTLLATIKSGNGFSAVIRTGESSSRVVETGDVLEGGFKVTKLEAGRAVLTDGRDVIVAKRSEH